MKAVLISIQPKWVEKIASGKKTVEVRKSRPKLETPFKVYIYCTKGRGDCLWEWCGDISYDTQFPNERPNRLDGKVIGEFVCDSFYGITNFLPYDGEDCHHSVTQGVLEQTCLEDYEIDEYLGKKDGYGWHISQLKIYDKPKELREFVVFCKNYYDGNCEDCKYFIDGRGYEYDESDCGCNGLKPIERPPQSWCYVEAQE